MKSSVSPRAILAVLACVSLVTPALAFVNIEWVTVGNAGNAADPFTGSLYGGVSYAYQIGKYEVTNAQYAEFLNAKGGSNSYGIYNAGMASYGITQNGSSGSFTYSVTGTLANHPVVYVSWFDTARFTNWLGNGQGSGDTSPTLAMRKWITISPGRSAIRLSTSSGSSPFDQRTTPSSRHATPAPWGLARWQAAMVALSGRTFSGHTRITHMVLAFW